MKKLFSIVLVAVGMFMSANAGVVTDPAQLQAALNAGGTVQLGGSALDFQIAEPLTLEINGEATLDLNGHNLVYAYDPEAYKSTGDTKRQQGRMINLAKGTLNVINSAPATGGSILNNTQGNASFAFSYYAKAGATSLSSGTEIVVFSVTGSTDKTAENYTVLNISEEISINVPKNGKVGIIINSAGSHTYGTYQTVSSKTTTKFATTNLTFGCSFGVVVNVNGTVFGNKYGIQVSGNVKAAPSLILPEGEYAGTVETLPLGEAWISKTTRYNFKFNDGYSADWLADAVQFPTLTIGSKADIGSQPQVEANGNGLYCGGYANVTINGYVHGSNGVYIKAGNVTIEDAVIKSENTNFTPTEGKKSGTEGSGNAIVIESNAGYPGGSTVTISGDSKIEAAGGYAIQETITTAGESKVDGVTIEGGTFKGGTKGGMIYSEETKSDGSVVITDGNMQNFKPGETDGILSGDNFIVKTEDGTIVVCSGTEPSWESGDLANDGEDYQWTTAKTQNIESDINVGFFDMEKGAVNVKAGKTLTVNRLVMGTDARIVVEVGARLIVDGNMGIVANQAENITIQAQENNMGQFLFNPAVNSNRHPMATVQFISKSYVNNVNDNLRQIFGSPMQAGSMKKITSDNASYWSRFDRDLYGDWDKIGTIQGAEDYPGSAMHYEYFDKEFAFYCITSNNPSSVVMTYNMTGNLLGNTQPEGFKILKGWTAAANSWTGNVSALAMIGELKSLGADPNVYTYEQSGNALIWHSHGTIANKITDIEPLQPIYLNNESSSVKAFDIMNYEQLVWNHAFPTPGAPAREIENDFTQATIRIANANGVSDYATIAEVETDNAVKFPNEVIRVYVSADRELDIYAADNVENTYIGFNGQEKGTYTVSFENVNGDNLVLVDLVNNREIAIVEGAEYQFEAKANTINPAHFQVRKVAEEVTTNVENAAVQNDVIKTIVNDQVVIIRNGVRYNAVGQRL